MPLIIISLSAWKHSPLWIRMYYCSGKTDIGTDCSLATETCVSEMLINVFLNNTEDLSKVLENRRTMVVKEIRSTGICFRAVFCALGWAFMSQGKVCPFFSTIFIHGWIPVMLYSNSDSDWSLLSIYSNNYFVMQRHIGPPTIRSALWQTVTAYMYCGLCNQIPKIKYLWLEYITL